ncbi:lineage-specific thermal regulator protein [Polystyrenella longa]|uniref:Lineage-specific thermal regulator protein n=1 Tax=Polystyrenella longa TaxID=2528007 RepID=A0A518CL03_9PLAN|nr:helix-turn-helix transcriptional regulator [Polystyrenella longa]QDU79864.1 lineage-specific thermal regulator protein [Polystyrenella longa]
MTDKTSEKASIDKFDSQLMRGSLDLMILAVLDRDRQYGYSILQELRDASAEKVDLKAGTLYPILHRLEAEKLIRSKWDESTGRKRKWYELTKAGHKRLQQQAQTWHAYVNCIQSLLPPSLAQPLPAT